MKALLSAVCIVFGGMGTLTVASTNLLTNGSFDAPDDPLKGWVCDYRFTGNSNYQGNHEHVSVVPENRGRRGVLRLSGTRLIFWGTGQGVKVDSVAVPFEFGREYRLSAWARTTKGPNCRLLIEGYQWKPGIKPHPAPALHELRKVYRQGAGHKLYFSDEKHGPFANPSTEWRRGECVFPSPDLSTAARRHLKKIRFLVVHVVAIDGYDGELYLDDVKLELLPEAAPRADQEEAR